MVSWLRRGQRGEGSRGQRGEGKLGLIIAIIVVVSAGYLVMKWVPVRTQSAEFTEFLERSSQRFAIGELTETQLMESILEFAQKEKIPLTEQDVTITSLTEKVSVRVKYTIDIPLVGGKVWPQNYDLQTEYRKF